MPPRGLSWKERLKGPSNDEDLVRETESHPTNPLPDKSGNQATFLVALRFIQKNQDTTIGLDVNAQNKLCQVAVKSHKELLGVLYKELPSCPGWQLLPERQRRGHTLDDGRTDPLCQADPRAPRT
jgi:hypothetical protein